MATTTFENIAAQIAAGTITSKEILQYKCSALTSSETQALLNSYAAKLVVDGTDATLASVQSGQQTDVGTIVVPQFLAGRIEFIDNDNTATTDLDGTHQYATDSEGDSYPEESSMEWAAVTGKFYANRTITIPTGVTALFTFVLKD
tara:strand:- start:145 stop:582 length:438 start_codon:yes stop_codon:yes gene_type:complete